MDAIEWIGEAISAIGVSIGFEQRTAILEVEEHSTNFPSGFVDLISVVYGGQDTTEDTFPSVSKHRLVLSNSLLHTGTHSSITGRSTTSIQETYQRRDGGLFLSLESGLIGIVYKSVPLSADGYPKVPDHFSFNSAFSWYIMYKLGDRGWKHPHLDYEDVEKRWLKYCTQARNVGAMFTLDQLEAFTKAWATLIPDVIYADRLYSTEDELSSGYFKSSSYGISEFDNVIDEGEIP